MDNRAIRVIQFWPVSYIRLGCSSGDAVASHCILCWWHDSLERAHIPLFFSCSCFFGQQERPAAWNTGPNLASTFVRFPGRGFVKPSVTLWGLSRNWIGAIELCRSSIHVQYPDRKDYDRSTLWTFQAQADPVVFSNIFFQSKKKKISSRTSVTCIITNLSANRFHRRPIGASTLTRRKKGRKRNRSRVVGSAMSVVTQRSCHLFVAKSSRESASWNISFGDLGSFFRISDACSRRSSSKSVVWYWGVSASSRSWNPCWIR